MRKVDLVHFLKMANQRKAESDSVLLSLLLGLEKLEGEWSEVARLLLTKEDMGFQHRGEIYGECSRQLRKTRKQNSVISTG